MGALQDIETLRTWINDCPKKGMVFLAVLVFQLKVVFLTLEVLMDCSCSSIIIHLNKLYLIRFLRAIL